MSDKGINPGAMWSAGQPLESPEGTSPTADSSDTCLVSSAKTNAMKKLGSRVTKAVRPRKAKAAATAKSAFVSDSEGKLLRSRRLGDEGLRAVLVSTAAMAEEKDKLRKEDNERLKAVVTSFGYRIQPVRADGSCWCTALATGISYQLPDMGTGYSPARIRELTVDALLANETELLEWFTVTGPDRPTLDDFRAECELARDSKFWKSETSSIGDLLLEGFSRGSDLNVRVLQDDGSVSFVGTTSDRRVVTVGYFKRDPEHYCALIPLTKRTGNDSESDGSVEDVRRFTTKRRDRIVDDDDDDDDGESVEPVSVSSVRPTSESDYATGGQMDVDLEGATSTSRKRPLQAVGDRLQFRCAGVMTQRDIDFLTKWRRWWGALLRGHNFTGDTEISFLYRCDSVTDPTIVDEFLRRCVMSERRRELMLKEEVLMLAYILYVIGQIQISTTTRSCYLAVIAGPLFKASLQFYELLSTSTRPFRSWLK